MAECKECMHKAVCHKALQIREDLLKKINCYDFKSAADVVEVEHGRWKKIECGTICTNCNRVYDKDFEFSYEKIKTYFKRCPECGAKMDGQ